MPSKLELRDKFKKLRSNISDQQKKLSEKLIIQNLEPLITNSSRTSIYYPLNSEVSLLDLSKANREILLPKISEDNLLKFYSCTEQLVLNEKFKIMEPEGKKEIEPEVIICPLLAFDSNKHRLGYGKGYFDRTLKQHPNSLKIGIAFSIQKSDELLPSEPHDHPLDYIVTEKEIF